MAGSRRALVGVAALLALGAAACDALLGLGQYKDCSEVGCPPIDASDEVFDAAEASQASDAGSSSSGDAGDASPEGGDGAAEGGGRMQDGAGPGDGSASVREWARWPMPNPDASAGGDSAALLPNTMVYDAGDGGPGATVFDTVTGLTWQQDGSQIVNSEQEAVSYCATLPSPMRLPTRIELVSIVDFTQQNPAIDQAVFTGTQSYYWTSSPVAQPSGSDGAMLYWTVDFTDGLVHDNASGTYVRCVAGGSP
jgi:hypothetical protein